MLLFLVTFGCSSLIGDSGKAGVGDSADTASDTDGVETHDSDAETGDIGDTDTDSGEIGDADGDGFSADDDCDDTNAAINPGATEVCNTHDDDCDGSVDEGFDYVVGWPDADSDGYGGPLGVMESGCPGTLSPGYVENADDCEDRDASINPGATEVCDAADVDENCNGYSDDYDPTVDRSTTGTIWYLDYDGDGYGDTTTQLVCDTAAGWSTVGGDCRGGDPYINPGMVDSCNGVDDDCNGVLDDDADEATPGARPYYRDQDVDYYGDALDADPQYVCSTESEVEYSDGKGLMTWLSDNNQDCIDTDSMIGPAVLEVPYDGIDQNCDHVDY